MDTTVSKNVRVEHEPSSVASNQSPSQRDYKLEFDQRLGRLYLLIVKGGKLVLRYRFDNDCPTPLETFLCDNKDAIIRLKEKKIIFQPSYDALYPGAGKSSSSEKYDITLLLALHRNFLCKRKGNDEFWKNEKPPDSDDSKEAAMVRLRTFRNEIMHYSKSGVLTEKEFDEKWNSIAKVLLRLGKDMPTLESDIKAMRKKSIDMTDLQEMTGILKEWDEQERAFWNKIIDYAPFELAMARSKNELMDVLKEEHFVETEIFKRAQEMLEDKGLVVLKGAQGEGKTTISKKLVKNPDECLKLNFPEEWNFCEHERVKIVLVDDMFGSAMFNKAESRKWLKCLPGMIDDIKSKRLKMIITSRSYILEEVLKKMFVSHLINEENTLTVSAEQLSHDEKKQILKNHMKLNERKNDSLVAECVELSRKTSAYIIGFPECVRIFCENDSLFNEGAQFFESPMTHIKKCLVQNEAFLAFFVLWAQPSQQLKLRDIEQSVKSTPESVRCAIEQFQCNPYDSLKTVRETLFNHRPEYIHFSSENETFRFNHRVLSDAVGLVVYDRNRTALLKYCDAPFIARYIRISDKNTDRTCVRITLMPERYDQLCLRIGELILQDHVDKTCSPDKVQQQSIDQYLNYSLFLHPAFESDKFCEAFFSAMPQKQIRKILTAPVSTIGTSLIEFKHILEKEIFETEIGVLAYALLKQPLSDLASACFSEMKSLITDSGTETDDVKKRMQTDVSMTMLVSTLHGDTNQIDVLVTKMDGQADNLSLIRKAIKKEKRSRVLSLLPKTNEELSRDYRVLRKSLLIISVEDRNTAAINCILSSKYFQDDEINCQIEENRKTALHIACGLGYSEIVEQLLVKNPDLQRRDSNQMCPIHSAALAGKIEIVKLLLHHDIKQTDYPVNLKEGLSMKLYHIAVMKGKTELIDLLLQLGVSPFCTDGNDNTPLVYALQASKWTIAKQLSDESIKQNAHTICDSEGNTALQVIGKLFPSEFDVHEYEEVKSKLEFAERSSQDKQDKTA